MAPRVGDFIKQRYRLVRLIGDGGMGSVFEAHHELLHTTVALKFLHPHLMRREGLAQRFLQEAQLSARIKSPHVVRASDVDQSETGLAYFVMEYVPGGTLEARYQALKAEGRWLTREEAFDYFLQILEGVEAAHELGIVHRDLKPDNVMVAKDDAGRVLLKILDFGVAKLKAADAADRGLTAPGAIMGTPEYMAPEQAFSPKNVDRRADIFALGVLFYEMLSGKRPVESGTLMSIADAYLKGRVAPLARVAGMDERLAAHVHRAISPRPEQRFENAAAFREAILPCMTAPAIPAAPAVPDLKAFAVTVDDPHSPDSAAPFTQPLSFSPQAFSTTVEGPPRETKRMGASTLMEDGGSGSNEPAPVSTLKSEPLIPPAASTLRTDPPAPASTLRSEPPPPMHPQMQSGETVRTVWSEPPPPVWTHPQGPQPSYRPSSMPPPPSSTAMNDARRHGMMALVLIVALVLAVALAAIAYAWSAGMFVDIVPKHDAPRAGVSLEP
jgi:serine/threonine-protein kinase